jgi:hypothetical protein
MDSELLAWKEGACFVTKVKPIKWVAGPKVACCPYCSGKQFDSELRRNDDSWRPWKWLCPTCGRCWDGDQKEMRTIEPMRSSEGQKS